MIKLNFQNQTAIFFFFVLISIILRFFSFFPAVLDHDESTYLIIGRDILNGKILYTDVTDTKPVGIFLFYAFLEFLFGSSIFLKRLVFAVLVGVTGFLIYRISARLFKNCQVALASGIIYILYVSIWIYHGLSPNTELIFNLTTSASLLLFLKNKIRFYIFGGLLMGIGFMVKYLVLFDFAAFLLFFFITDMRPPENRFNSKIWTKYILAGLFFLLPFGLTNLYFLLNNNFNDFHFITYILPGNYSDNPSILRYLVMLLDLTGKFLPISFIVFYVLFKKNKPWKQNDKWFFTLWILFVLVAMFIPGQELSHYTIQLMLPLSVACRFVFSSRF
jgi:4-amino-4-deoxy-L-arabinose transferase-like glycosyltransferase